MKHIVFILTLIHAVTVFSCQNKEQKESSKDSSEVKEEASSEAKKENILYKEVMAIHDEVMPLMGELMAMNKKVKGKDSTSHEANELSAYLEEANEAMMNWMRKFNPNIENMTHEETMNYLEEEKKKIMKVKEKMLSAQDQATVFLEEVQ